jgi:hypothetical protein
MPGAPAIMTASFIAMRLANRYALIASTDRNAPTLPVEAFSMTEELSDADLLSQLLARLSG